jgi:hypothetical protein
MTMTPEAFAKDLMETLGDNLKSVVLYGSAARDDHSKKFSDFNVFCVLNDPSPAELAKGSKVIKKWVKGGNPPPHFFSADHIATSLDVFPMEFLDMKDKHRVLVGDDPLTDISVDPKNLRHQCESELKGKVLHLRAYFACHSQDTKKLAEAVVASFPAILASFRAVLRLTGKTPPADSKATVEMLAQLTDINPDVFLGIVAVRRSESLMPRGEEVLAIFERYLTELETVTTFVDGM